MLRDHHQHETAGYLHLRRRLSRCSVRGCRHALLAAAPYVIAIRFNLGDNRASVICARVLSSRSTMEIVQPLKDQIEALQDDISQLETKIDRLTTRKPNYHVTLLKDWRHGVDPLNPAIVYEYMSLFPPGVTLSYGGVCDETDGRLFLEDLESFVPRTGCTTADNHSRAVLLAHAIKGPVLNAWSQAYKSRWFGMLEWIPMREWFLAKYQTTMDPMDYRQVVVGRLMHLQKGNSTTDQLRVVESVLGETCRLHGKLSKHEKVVLGRLVGVKGTDMTWETVNEELRTFLKTFQERQLLDSRVKKEDRM